MKLSFSTLACPDWTVDEVARAARAYGYDGVELRLVNGTPIDSTVLRDNIDMIRTGLDGLPITSLNSSIQLAVDGEEWESEFRALSGLASELSTSSVRVWGGEHDTPQVTATAQVIARLNIAGQIAAGDGITVAFETHDDWRDLGLVREVFDSVHSDAVKVLWDLQNTHAVGGSSPDQVWEALGSRIQQVHVKDARPGPGAYGELVLLGDGDVPIRESINVLSRAHFDGWVTVNWLKFQHPEIPAPDIALPHYARVLRQWMDAAETVA